jgi:nicotinamidase-related amidase
MITQGKSIKRGGIAAVLLGSLGLFGCKSGPNFTQGPRIEAYASPRTALLIIDIQEDYTGPQAKQPYRDAERIVNATNRLLAEAEAKETLVVFIENVIDNSIVKVLSGGLNAPGSPGIEMDRRLLRPPGTRTFTKLDSDAFSNSDFDAYLRKNHVDHVVITGLDAAVCVNATALGALNRGYKVTMFTEGIASNHGNGLEKWITRWREAGAEVK